jgi:hypothetical protein
MSLAISDVYFAIMMLIALVTILLSIGGEQ